MIVEITPELIAQLKAERTAKSKTRKVSDEQVRLIRLLDEQGLRNGEIAKFVNLPPQYVSHIRRAKAYNDVVGKMTFAEATALLKAQNSDEELQQDAPDSEPTTFFAVD